ncbi:MAG: DUF342 domain-containing protein, partial [Planctomycetes bacterium]|nr:DUF342 domain-containing protein [Planctomycetota bacterium]
KLSNRIDQNVLSSQMQDLPRSFSEKLDNFVNNDRLRVLQSEFCQRHFLHLCISPSGLEAFLSLYKSPTADSLSLDDARSFLSTAGIVYGITEDHLKKFLNVDFFTTSFIGTMVALGRKSEAGEAGKIELLKRPYNSSHPRDLEEFDQVFAEEEIAHIIPPIKGVPGVNVLGEEIPCPFIQGVEYRFNQFIHTINTGDQVSLMASSNGYLKKYDSEISLNKEFKVSGDITIHRGNLIYANDVVVNGNICDNTSLNIGGNLNVNGMVEQCQLQVDKDLYINKGIFGRANCNVVVKGRINCKYINETEVECDGIVHVEKEILNSQIWCKDSLEAVNAVIVGGSLFSQDTLTAKTLGSELGLKTLICVGLDYQEYRIEKLLKPDIVELEEKILETKEHARKASGDNAAIIQEHIESMEGEKESKEQEIQYLEQHILKQNLKGEIIVSESIHPGVTMMIGFAEMTVKQTIVGPVKITWRDEENLLIQPHKSQIE